MEEAEHHRQINLERDRERGMTDEEIEQKYDQSNWGKPYTLSGDPKKHVGKWRV